MIRRIVPVQHKARRLRVRSRWQKKLSPLDAVIVRTNEIIYSRVVENLRRDGRAW